MAKRHGKRAVTADLGDEVVADVVEQYLKSGDFNGFDWSYMARAPEFTPEVLKSIVRPLIASRRVSVRFSDDMPFIKRLPDPPVDYQLEKLAADSMQLVRLFPTVEEMKRRVRASRYPGRPFTLELARGHAQLEPRFFDPIVLEQYLNDPRYWCQVSDTSGSIHTHDDAEIRDADRVYIQTFGFAYNSDLDRAVVVYLRYLHDLSPQHQQLWRARELHGDYQLHPDYFRGSLVGIWPEHIEILDAILLEQKAINDLARLIKGKPLFRKEFAEGRPDGLRFLIRPTRREYLAFAHVLDKIISENINTDFFAGEVELVETIDTRTGPASRQKGSLRIFEEWLRRRFHPRDYAEESDPIAKAFAPFRKVRKLRQQPAHALDDDAFDHEIFKHQRELIVDVYYSLKGLRLAFQQHPLCASYTVDEFLDSGKVRIY
jgi:hypothetical protein